MKLPVIEICREIYVFIWRERRWWWSLTLPAIVLVTTMDALLAWFGHPDYSFDGIREVYLDGPFWAKMVLPFAWVLDEVLLLLFAVAWHRAYLAPEPGVTVRNSYRWTSRSWWFAWATVRTIVPLSLLSAIIALAAGELGLLIDYGDYFVAYFTVMVLLGAGVWWYLFSRVSVILPATAMDRYVSLRAVWGITAGNGIRISLIGLVALLPPTAVWALLNLAFRQMGLPAQEDSLVVNFVVGLSDRILSFASIALGVTSLSICYRYLTEEVQPLGADGDSV